MGKQSVYRVDTVVPKGEKHRYYEVAAETADEAKAAVEQIEQDLADNQPANGAKATSARKAGKTTEL